MSDIRSPRSLVSAALLSIVGVPAASPAAAQDSLRTPARLPAVDVTVTRERARSPLDLPYSVTAARPDSARPGQRHLSFDELLLAIPGLAVANRTNPTQDPRISIRGFGARSAFGVRGVRVLRDGVPLTLPDGQTPIDYLDLEAVGRVDVVRGAASSLYGNAAGGVIDVRSPDAPLVPLAGRVNYTGGSDDLRRLSAGAGGRSGAWRYQGTLSRTEQDGFRHHARQRVTSGSARLERVTPTDEAALTATAYDMPLAENPGALTLAEMRADRRQSDPAQIRRATGKEASQTQVGLSYLRRWSGEREASAVVHAGTRTLDNPLTFAVVDIDRVVYGASLRATTPFTVAGLVHRVSVGADAQVQDDDRLNFANCTDATSPSPQPGPACPVAGRQRGEITLDQRELVTSVGPFVRDEIAIGSRVLASVGVRGDAVRFDVDDRLRGGTNPDDSGVRTLSAVSPMAGVVVRLGLLHAAHANVSTAFETPTATELANQPDGGAGLNRELDPQYATTYELGAKGLVAGRVRYDASAFLANVRDELIPFEIAGGAGRRYFRNAGRTVRRGAELGLATAIGPVETGLAYTYSDFVFDEYVVGASDFSDNRIPGIPIQKLEGYATLRRGPAFATLEGSAAGGVYLDDANTRRGAGWEVANVRVGATVRVLGAELRPVLGVQNLFDRRYAGSFVVNAAGGRFYEPAPGRTVYVALGVGTRR